MFANRMRRYSHLLLERNLRNQCRKDSRGHSPHRRGFASIPRFGRLCRSWDLSPRRDMHPILSRTSPLNILIIPSEAQPDIAPCLSALKSHWTLVCPVASDVVDSARRFEPDVVVVDEDVPGFENLPLQLAGSASSRNPVFVVLTRSDDEARGGPTGYSHCPPLPATAVELEHLLWRIRRTAIGQSAERSSLPET